MSQPPGQPPLANLTQLHTIMVGSVSQGQEIAPQRQGISPLQIFSGGVSGFKSNFFSPQQVNKNEIGKMLTWFDAVLTNEEIQATTHTKHASPK